MTEDQKIKNREYQKKYRESHQEDVKARKKQYYQENKEKIKQKSANWYNANKEMAKETRLRYYNTRKDSDEFKKKQKQYNEQYRQSGRAKISQEKYRNSEMGKNKIKEWYQDNKDEILVKRKQLYENNKDEILLKQKEKSEKLRRQIVEGEIDISSLKFYTLNGYIVEVHTHIPKHRIIMHCFDENLHVHHIDTDKQNNAKDNLFILTPSEHIALHNKMRAEQRIYNRNEIIKFVNEYKQPKGDD